MSLSLVRYKYPVLLVWLKVYQRSFFFSHSPTFFGNMQTGLIFYNFSSKNCVLRFRSGYTHFFYIKNMFIKTSLLLFQIFIPVFFKSIFIGFCWKSYMKACPLIKSEKCSLLYPKCCSLVNPEHLVSSKTVFFIKKKGV